jgi:thymidylate synthase (FAD)
MIREGHWSPFEMANMVLEIETSRAISAQILRHRSFSFQEFSQRYAEVPELAIKVYDPRRQDTENRQHSIDDLSKEDKNWFSQVQLDLAAESWKVYQEALDRGIAKESARFLLPLNSMTRLYMNGTIRSWIHYLSLRTPEHGTQKEHSDLVAEAKDIFVAQFPTISEALEWT